MKSPQHFLSGFDTVVLGLFENGNAAQVGVGKEDSAIQMPHAAPLFGENRADGGARFIFTLPFAQAAQVAPERVTPPTAEVSVV